MTRTRVSEQITADLAATVDASRAAVSSLITPVYNVKGYDAKGDGTTDDTAECQAAIDAAEAAGGGVVYFPYTDDGYLITSTLTVPPTVSVLMDGHLLMNASGTAIQIGNALETTQQQTYKLNVIRNSQADWTSETDIGIKVIRAYGCTFDVVHANNFTIGLQVLGDTSGIAYNQFNLQQVKSNKYGIDLVSTNGGWCNENLFLNGNITVGSSANPGESRYGVRMRSVDGVNLPGNNLFVKPSFELNLATATPGEAVPVLIQYGEYNRIIGARHENCSPTFARLQNGSRNNRFDIASYDEHVSNPQSLVDEEGTLPSSVVTVQNFQMTTGEATNALFKSGPMDLRYSPYDATTMHFTGMQWLNKTAPHDTVNVSSSLVTMHDGYVTFHSGYGSWSLGVYINTENIRRMVVRRNIVSGAVGKLPVNVKCFDAAGNVLGSAGANHPYVKTTGSASLAYTTNWGGMYAENSYLEGDFYIWLHPDVKKVFVGLGYAQDGDISLRSFSIYNLDPGDGDGVPEYNYGVRGQGVRYGTQAPTWGTWETRDIVWNSSPTAGGYIGWVCVSGGTPGTWKGFGAIQV